MGYLKSEKVRINSIDEEIEVRELSALGQQTLIKAWAKDGEDALTPVAIQVKYGTAEWSEASVDEILAMFNIEQLKEISDHVTRLSGLDVDEEELEKNSESDQIDS